MTRLLTLTLTAAMLVPLATTSEAATIAKAPQRSLASH